MPINIQHPTFSDYRASISTSITLIGTSFIMMPKRFVLLKLVLYLKHKQKIHF